MRTLMGLCVVGLLAFASMDTPQASANYRSYGRQYYGTWSYNNVSNYHYRQYYYKPVITAPTYSYHYVISYPTTPTYYHYYNPVKRYYWGRYDTAAKGYSLLAEADRKEKIEDIKDSAFPKPGNMPNIPDAEDKVAMEAPPVDAPKPEKK